MTLWGDIQSHVVNNVKLRLLKWNFKKRQSFPGFSLSNKKPSQYSFPSIFCISISHADFSLLVKNFWIIFHYFLKGKKKLNSTAGLQREFGLARGEISGAGALTLRDLTIFDKIWSKKPIFYRFLAFFFAWKNQAFLSFFFSPVLELTCQVKNTRALSFSLVAHTHTR